MCAVYTPTTKQDWVKSTFGLDLPKAGPEVYPGHQGSIVVRSRRDARTAIGLAQFVNTFKILHAALIHP